MRDIRVYTEQPLTTGEEVVLDSIASRHLSTVLRLKPGNPVTLFNGQGGEYQATLKQCTNKQVTACIDRFDDIDRESPLMIHLGIGLSRGDRMDWVIQKATEAGVTALTPLYTEHTEVKLKGDRAEKKMRHWQQIAISACEQCYRTKLPTIHPPALLDSWLAQTGADKKLVLHHRSQQTIGELKHQPTTNVALLIGPEGGLSAREIQGAEAADYSALTLGPRVLRTETAPIVAISILQSIWGDYQ